MHPSVLQDLARRVLVEWGGEACTLALDDFSVAFVDSILDCRLVVWAPSDFADGLYVLHRLADKVLFYTTCRSADMLHHVFAASDLLLLSATAAPGNGNGNGNGRSNELDAVENVAFGNNVAALEQ